MSPSRGEARDTPSVKGFVRGKTFPGPQRRGLWAHGRGRHAQRPEARAAGGSQGPEDVAPAVRVRVAPTVARSRARAPAESVGWPNPAGARAGPSARRHSRGGRGGWGTGRAARCRAQQKLNDAVGETGLGPSPRGEPDRAGTGIGTLAPGPDPPARPSPRRGLGPQGSGSPRSAGAPPERRRLPRA